MKLRMYMCMHLHAMCVCVPVYLFKWLYACLCVLACVLSQRLMPGVFLDDTPPVFGTGFLTVSGAYSFSLPGYTLSLGHLHICASLVLRWRMGVTLMPGFVSFIYFKSSGCFTFDYVYVYVWWGIYMNTGVPIEARDDRSPGAGITGTVTRLTWYKSSTQGYMLLTIGF